MCFNYVHTFCAILYNNRKIVVRPHKKKQSRAYGKKHKKKAKADLCTVHDRIEIII